MTASISSRVRLLLGSAPLDRVDPELLASSEDQVQAWQLDVGQQLAAENVPFAYVCLVVDGTLRVSGRDAMGQAFTIRRVHAGEWWGLWSGLQGVAASTCRTTGPTKLLAVPLELWQRWWQEVPSLAAWVESHPQREDVYAALRPLLVERPRQDRSILDELDHLQSSLTTAQLLSLSDLDGLTSDNSTSWLLPCHDHFLAEISLKGPKGLSRESLLQALERSTHGLRLIGCPAAALEELMVSSVSSLPLETNGEPESDAEVVEALPEWQNPDGEALLKAALQEENPRPQKDRQGLLVKPIFGSSGVEQGIALLQMICESLSVPFRRDVVDRMLKGMVGEKPSPTLECLGQIADSLGLSAVLMNIPVAHLARMSLPALLELPDEDSLVLLTGERHGHLRVIDPREGERYVDLASLEKEHSSARAVAISRRPDTSTRRFDITYFFPYLQRYRKSLALVFVASFFMQIFNLAQPLLIQQIIDKVIGQQNFNTLYFLGVLLIGSSVISNILSLIRTFLFTDTTNRIDIATTGNIFTHLFKLPLDFFDKRPIGEISTRIAELGSIRGFLTGTALTLILDVVFGVIYLFVLISYSGLLTAVSLSVVPLYLAMVYLVAPIIKRQLRIAAESAAAAQSLMIESLTGIQTVKAQHAETTLRWRWQQRHARTISAGFRTSLIGATSGAIGGFFQQVGGLAVLWVGAYLVLKGDLTIGQLIAFRIISGNVVGPIIRLAGTWQTIQGLQISIERLSDVVDAPTEQPVDETPIALPPISGKVEFEDVSFSFNPHLPPVVKSVSFCIEAGKFVGIVGQSGSGKSTIMKLLPRLYRLEKGVIRIDDYDIAKVDIDSLRQQIGIVPQDSMLFDGTVRENITLNAPDASDEEVIHAARISCAHGFIMDLPQGYGSRVGERGASLSGGQRQRLAIARAILSRPRMLILDEATSALDYLTERTLCENLRRELSGDTVFFITHRLATIRSADAIMLLENGLLQEVGTHQELLARKGLYYALYRQQDASSA
ncbi:Toxin RTX-I translocation ATP-binding protein [Prochlorococcus marinus str. MIT 1313]|uniref:peptidase domain-containing ABC transporter n=1 Tax=Prochlorococcus TaxID=1218 RepID=UPI0007B3A702|nr:peptidase domain-containing ABC transporter [Prochlorococcus marinus]KZR72338.1 Toxin RTX-I translocation ATP-binding protein [Prochlorococcus marinus str. MIT 1313]KZR74069.1 Toxin RTX-I translocation ATP-binding protein [Prochlorococcus marinus str. MIT 1318]